MSVDVKAPDNIGRASWLTVRLVGALFAGGGWLSEADALDLAEQSVAQQTCRKRPYPRQRLREAIRPLLDDGVVVLVDGVWYAPDVADLGAWLADALEARADRGLADNPTIPRARSAA